MLRGPNPIPLDLTAAERHERDQVVRRHNTPQQIALRARIVLAAADKLNHSQIARHLGISVDTVRRWRQRWLGVQPAALDDVSVLERLADAPRPGKPARIRAEQGCQVVALACEAPPRTGRPISQWTARAIAAEIRQRGIVDQISDRHAARRVQRGRSNPTAGAPG